MPSRLHVTSSSAMGFAGAFFGAMGSNPAIQYVAPDGNDSASGADWTNAKQTILAAYDAFPANGGGVIYIADNSYVGGEVANQGIWIIGPNDPLYATPPTGWRKQKRVRFVGVGQGYGLQFDVGNAVWVKSGQPSGGGNWPLDANHPFIWASGTNTGLWFESLATVYPAIGIRLGVSADQTSRSVNTAVIYFRDVVVAVNNNGGGPVVDVGYAFWVFWENCALIGAYNDSGGTPLALTADAHAVMLLKPDPTGPTPGLFTIRNNRWAAGGLKFTRGGSVAGTLYIEDLLVEADGSHPLPPVMWITNLDKSWSSVIVRGVSQADDIAGSMPAVQIDGNADASDAVMCIGVDGHIQGPCTILGNDPASAGTLVVSPFRSAQLGIRGRRLVGQHDSARRGCGLVAARFANLAQQDVTLWSGLTGSAVVTTGQTAPDGTTNAALLTASSGIQNRQVYRAARTFAVGDIVMIGSWLRGSSGAGVGGGQTSIFFGQTSTGFTWVSLDGGTTVVGATNIAVIPPFAGDGGEWVWLAGAWKFTAIGTNPTTTLLALQVDSTHPAVFYAPIFLHIPTGTISDNEAAELMAHLQSWSNAATIGHISPLKGQVINAIGGLATITKAGAPVDGDYGTPVDGMIVTDTTNNKIWTRIGGVWKGVAVT